MSVFLIDKARGGGNIQGMRFRAILFVVFLGLSTGYGCGNEGVAPSSYLDEPQSCPSLESMMPITIGMVERGELSELRAVLSGELDGPSQQLLIHMISGALQIVPPSRLPELAALGQSELTPKILQLLHNLLLAIDGFSPDIQRGFDEGLHRLSQSCPIEPLLRTAQRGATHMDTILEVLPILLGGDEGILNNSSVEPQSWLDLYVGVLELVSALPGSESDLEDLIRFLAALPGLEVLEKLAVIFEDALLLEHLGEVVRCLNEVEADHDFGLLRGVAYISASEAMGAAPGVLSAVVDDAQPKGTDDEMLVHEIAEEALVDLIDGLLESPDLMESIRYSLDWFFYPDRAARIRADMAALFGSGAVEELLTAVSKIGIVGCELETVSSGNDPQAIGP